MSESEYTGFKNAQNFIICIFLKIHCSLSPYVKNLTDSSYRARFLIINYRYQRVAPPELQKNTQHQVTCHMSQVQGQKPNSQLPTPNPQVPGQKEMRFNRVSAKITIIFLNKNIILFIIVNAVLYIENLLALCFV